MCLESIFRARSMTQFTDILLTALLGRLHGRLESGGKNDKERTVVKYETSQLSSNSLIIMQLTGTNERLQVA